MWQDDGRRVRRNWYGAKRYCERLKLGGFTDWRLPSKNELIYLYRNKYKLKHRIDGNYISSYTNTNEFGSKSYWLISFYDGYTTWRDVSNDYDVICVR